MSGCGATYFVARRESKTNGRESSVVERVAVAVGAQERQAFYAV